MIVADLTRRMVEVTAEDKKGTPLARQRDCEGEAINHLSAEYGGTWLVVKAYQSFDDVEGNTFTILCKKAEPPRALCKCGNEPEGKFCQNCWDNGDR
jgi:hypothetical protein